ncbi:transcription factor bHLH51 [Fagus crenata]
MDKAALLGTVIDHVKDLKRKAMEVSKACTLPTEVDEVTIDYDLAQDVNLTNVDKSKDNVFIKASFCCDDRPELFSELIHVLKGLRLAAVKADIASVGGRIRSILVLCTNESEVGVCVSTLKQSLKLVLSKIASSSVQSKCRIEAKGRGSSCHVHNSLVGEHFLCHIRITLTGSLLSFHLFFFFQLRYAVFAHVLSGWWHTLGTPIIVWVCYIEKKCTSLYHHYWIRALV